MPTGSLLGQRIRDIRRRMKLTQAELAGGEFTKSFISQIEKGQTRPSLKSLQLIARRLNQPVSYFLEETVHSTTTSSELMSLIEVGNTYHANGNLQEALETYKKALPICPSSNYDCKGEIRFRIGHIYFIIHQFDKAIDEFTLAVGEFQRGSAVELHIRALNGLGSAYHQEKTYQKARQAYEDSLALFSRLGIASPYLKLIVLCNLSNVSARLKEYEKTLRLLSTAINLSKTEGDYYKFGEICHILGFVHDAVGNYTIGLKFTQDAIDFYRLVQDTPLEISSIINKGIHLRKLHRRDSAYEVTFDALNRAREHDLTAEIARAHAELSHLALDDNNSKKAIEQIQIALQLAPLHEDVPEWVALLVKCSEKKALPEGVILAVENFASRWRGEPRSLAEIHSNLGELYKSLGDTTKANEHLSRSVALYAASR